MLPAEFLRRMERLLADEYEAFLASYDRPRNTALRCNPRKTAEVSAFATESVPWANYGKYLHEAVRPGLHPFHDGGVYYLQEPSAMAPVTLLDPQPGERVLDLCAAPGGKTTQIAAAMAGEGLLVCNEIHPKRARILASNIERMGVSNALVLNEHPAKLEERFVGYFDKILVDAPCSGEGMFRKEDAAVTDWSQETVEMCAGRQKEILNSAAKMLRPGGRLVYSTCTFAPEENEGTLSAFLHSHPEFSVERVEAPWFAPGRPEWVEEPAPGLERTFRLWPHKLRGEGHYAGVLRKQEGMEREPIEEPLRPLPKEIQAFLDENAIGLRGRGSSFGDTWFLCPEGLPALKGLKVLRAGLELGEVRKGRFVPAHALALWLDDFPRKADYPGDSREIAAYLRGETLFDDRQGWVLITVEGCSLGWAKGSGGVLKNHYPKGLRRV